MSSNFNNYIYSRVSTNQQGPDSLDVQRAICENFLISNNLELNGTFDEVSSAYNGKQKVLEGIIESKLNSNIIVKNISRFSRDVLKGMGYIEKAKSKNIIFWFVDDHLNTSNPTNYHQIRVKMSEAQLESENISKRSKDAIKVKKAKGWKFGKAKFGYKAIIENGIRKMRSNIDEKKIVDFISEARHGRSCRILNGKLKKIVANPPPIFFYDKYGNRIENFDSPKTLTYKEISDLLNSYNISNRGNLWKSSTVSRTLKVKDSYELIESKGFVAINEVNPLNSMESMEIC